MDSSAKSRALKRCIVAGVPAMLSMKSHVLPRFIIMLFDIPIIADVRHHCEVGGAASSTCDYLLNHACSRFTVAAQAGCDVRLRDQF